MGRSLRPALVAHRGRKVPTAMLAGSHVALGAAAWIAVAPHLGRPPLDPEALALAVAGGLLPDIDHPKSWVGRRLRPVSDIVARIFGHRGITHSLLAVLGCAWLLRQGGLPPRWAEPLVAGYLSHLLGDLLTPQGLRLLWPVRGTWALPFCRTGSPFEPLVVAVVLVAAWSTLAEPPDPRAALRRFGLCLGCAAEAPLPLPPRPPPAPKRRLAGQDGPGAIARAAAEG